MKIALFSPLNPVKTGISDYTEEMLFEMKKHVDIDLVIDQGYEPQNEKIRAYISCHRHYYVPSGSRYLGYSRW